jgi:subfamily B ATP-binding cassette protein MsbA
MTAALLVWMAGPLLMTLFSTSGVEIHENDKPETQIAENVQADETKSTDYDFDFLIRTKNNIKDNINGVVIGSSRKETLINFCILIICIAVGSSIFLYSRGFFMAYVQQSVIRDFRNRLFEKYQKLSLGYFHRQRTGQLMSRVTNDVLVLNDTVDLSFNHLVTDSLTVILLASFLLLLSWKLTLLAALVLPLVFGFIYWMGKKLRKYSRRSQEKMADVNSVLEETISNIRIVKAYAMEKFESKKFFETTADFFRALVRMTRIRHLASPVNDLLIIGAGILILFIAGTRIIEGGGELDAGDFITFIVAMFAMVKPTKSLFSIHIKIQEGLAAAERIFRVLDAPIVVEEKPDAIDKRSFDSVIKYEKVSFSYNESEPVIENLSFELKKGEVLALVGPSGAGKSTVVDLLPRFYDPREGCITIDGTDIKELKLNSLRNLLGMVTQEPILFNDTIYSNIAYGLNEIPLEQVIEAARAANADRFIQRFEKKYDTIVGARGVRLSGGQKQRITIARALLRNPEILIFDEATSSLDTEAELLVQEAIDHLMSNRTTLVIAHRLSTIKNADRILVIDNGVMVEIGKHEELLDRKGLYHRLYMMQFREDE